MSELHLIEGPYRNGRVLPRLPDGGEPEFLFRIMSVAEFEAGMAAGAFRPRAVMHASVEPMWEYAEPGDGNVLVAIRYDDADGWMAKCTLQTVVASSWGPVDAANVSEVGRGRRADLEASHDAWIAACAPAGPRP